MATNDPRTQRGPDETGPADASPLRVAFVFRAPLGGLFRHVLDVARGLIDRGHMIGIVCDSAAGNDHSEKMLAAIAPQLALGLERFPIRRNPALSDLAGVLRTRSILRSWAPDIVHGHGSKGGLYARLAPRRLGGKAVVRAYTPHGGSLNYQPGTLLHRLFMAVEWLLARRTELFLFESEYARRRFVEFVCEPAGEVRVVRNGVYEAEFAPVVHEANPADLVYVGEFRAAKGLDVLVEALDLVRARIGRNLRLVLVGSGPDEGDLRRRITEKGMEGSTTFLTPRPIREALARAEIIVVPSLVESLPYVSLEAAAAAQPMVSTNVGGIPEVFGPFEHELVPGGDAGALADAIAAMIALSPQQRTARAEALAGHVRQNFTVKRMIDGVVAGYADATGRARLPDGISRPRAKNPPHVRALHP